MRPLATHETIARALCRYYLLLFAVLYLAIASQVHAHESIGSVSNAIVIPHESQIEYYLSIPPTLADLLDANGYTTEAALREYFSWTLKIVSRGADCQLSQLAAVATQVSGNRIIHLTFGCEQWVTDLTITSTEFLDLDEKHIQFLKLAAEDDPKKVIQEGILTLDNPVFHAADVNIGSSVHLYRVTRFFMLGIRHILSGYDHIAFILAAILVVPGFVPLLKLVTSFTVAHSITLSLAFFGVVSLSANIVEPLIALTIAVVAFENVLFKTFKWRWLLIFCFGLIHGLGFVGVLQQITISRQELLVALLAFNLGIEAGQLAIVAAGVGGLYYLRQASWAPVLVRWLSVLIGMFGLTWFFSRLAGAGVFA